MTKKTSNGDWRMLVDWEATYAPLWSRLEEMYNAQNVRGIVQNPDCMMACILLVPLSMQVPEPALLYVHRYP